MEEKKQNNNIVKIVVGVVIVIFIIVAVIYANDRKEKNNVKDALSKISNATNNDGSGAITDNKNNTTLDKQYAQVNIGQTITIEDFLEYSFIETKFTTKLEPSQPDLYYHYYEAKSADNTLLGIRTKIKNLQTEQYDGEKLPKATVMYDGKYKYDCKLIVEEDDGSDLQGYDWYMDIEPLKSKNFYYYVELPKEVETDGKSLTLRIDLKSNSYELKIR